MKKKKLPAGVFGIDATMRYQGFDDQLQGGNAFPNCNVGDFVDVTARMKIIRVSNDMQNQSLSLQSDGAFKIKKTK